MAGYEGNGIAKQICLGFVKEGALHDSCFIFLEKCVNNLFVFYIPVLLCRLWSCRILTRSRQYDMLCFVFSTVV